MKCKTCKDKRVILVQRPSVPHGDYYELCKCQTIIKKNEYKRKGRKIHSIRPGSTYASGPKRDTGVYTFPKRD